MFVLDRAKSRAAALVMTAIAGVQMWPSAYADTTQPIVKETDTHAQKKVKKKKLNDPSESKLEEIDPIELLFKNAKKQLGKPYRWGATGPSAFDCSGFTGYVYRSIGVELPRTSSAQRAGTKHVPLEKIKPGDLVFAPGHVGLYLGKGKMIHSPRSGRVVSIDPIHSNAYGAGRPKL